MRCLGKLGGDLVQGSEAPVADAAHVGHHRLQRRRAIDVQRQPRSVSHAVSDVQCYKQCRRWSRHAVPDIGQRTTDNTTQHRKPACAHVGDTIA